jgi:hypothetical protein
VRRPMRPINSPFATRILPVAVGVALATGCAGKIDRFTVDRIVDRAMGSPDLGEVCAMGSSLDLAIGSATKETNQAHRALVISSVSSALCADERARELALEGARARQTLTGPDRSAVVKDLRIEEDRAHRIAAARFLDALAHAEAEYGQLGETCPNVSERDEIVVMLGLVAGVNALLHDRASGGTLDVPLDLVLRLSRAAPCLDADRWWSAPISLEAAAWALIPGAGPEGTDPWAVLEQAAVAGDATGVRVARALQVVVASTAGREADVERGIRAHGASLVAVPADPDWLLLDAYALALTQHESDLLWIASEGHRTETFGELPSDAVESAPAVDVFSGSDPFSGDPFAAPDPSPSETPEESP